MTTIVQYTRNGHAIGRNGSMKVTGMEIMDTQYPKDQIMITPINTKGIGNGCITIPKEDVSTLISELQKLL